MVETPTLQVETWLGWYENARNTREMLIYSGSPRILHLLHLWREVADRNHDCVKLRDHLTLIEITKDRFSGSETYLFSERRSAVGIDEELESEASMESRRSQGLKLTQMLLSCKLAEVKDLLNIPREI